MLHKFKIVFLLLFCWSGLVVIVSATTSIAHGYFAQSWPIADGIITEAVWDNNGSDDGPPCNKVNYLYKVRGTSHTGQQIIFGSICFNTDEKAYEKDQIVRVHYNPDDPSQAVLLVGVQGIYWFFMAAGLLFLLFGIGAIWFENRSKRPVFHDGEN